MLYVKNRYNSETLKKSTADMNSRWRSREDCCADPDPDPELERWLSPSSVLLWCQTDSYSRSQAVYLSIRFRAEGFVCAITSKKSAVVTVSNRMVDMVASSVDINTNQVVLSP